MSLGKELLLSCLVMIHISFMASRPIGLNNLRKNLQIILGPCQDLKRAENNYINYAFPEQPQPSELSIPMKGITMGNTTKEINTSICAINNYLNNHIKEIISDTLVEGSRKQILNDIEMFTDQFKAAVNVSTTQCNITGLDGLDDHKKKVTGCKILSSVRQWVEHFSHHKCDI